MKINNVDPLQNEAKTFLQLPVEVGCNTGDKLLAQKHAQIRRARPKEECKAMFYAFMLTELSSYPHRRRLAWHLPNGRKWRCAINLQSKDFSHCLV